MTPSPVHGTPRDRVIGDQGTEAIEELVDEFVLSRIGAMPAGPGTLLRFHRDRVGALAPLSLRSHAPMQRSTARSQNAPMPTPRSLRLVARAAATAALFGLLTAIGSAQAVLRVDADLTSGANDGSSWANAYQGSAGLHQALSVAQPGDEVWLRVGTYRPAAVANPAAQFSLATDNVTVRGGFAGTEVTPLERVLDAGRETVLSGDLLGDDDGTTASTVDNSALVLRVAANGASLEDLRVTGGGNQVDGASFWLSGTLGSPATRDGAVRRCVFDGGLGSGAVVQSNAATTRIVDCTFRANVGNGLEVVSRERRIQIDRCWTLDNGGDGLAVSTNDPGLPVTNVVSARNGGRGIFLRFVDSEGFAGASFEHCTVAHNSGFALEVDACCGVAFTNFVDSIARGNNGGLAQFSNGGTAASLPSQTNSLVQGAPGADADPLFQDPANGDYRLGPGSPAIDRAASPDGVPFDAAGQYRAFDVPAAGALGSDSDLGALEATGTLGRHDECSAELNSTGRAGRLFARGSDEVLAGAFSLVADQLPPGQFCVLLASRTRGLVPAVGGPGTLCLGRSIGRFNAPGQVLPASVEGFFALSIDLAQVPQPSAFVAVHPGDTWRFQLWHRDVPGPSQFTGVVTVAFR